MQGSIAKRWSSSLRRHELVALLELRLSNGSARAWLLRYAQTAPGKLVLLACFGALLRLHGEAALTLSALLMLPTFLPAHRRALVALGTLIFTWKLVPDKALLAVAAAQGLPSAFDARWLYPTQLATALLVCVAYAQLVARLPNTWLSRHPVTTLLAPYVALLAVATHGVLVGLPQLWLWGLIVGIGHYLWFLAYTMKDRAAARGRGELLLQAGAFHPFWSPSLTPFPKGGSYLRKIEAKSPEALAVCQLKALKLALWALCLALLNDTWNAVLHGTSGTTLVAGVALPSWYLPEYEDALAASAAGTPLAAHLNWLSLFSKFIDKLLGISVYGHVIIATCRMAGFAALRNTYSPLRSRSLADFWNRVYYYFKELLVDFFFYPTFFRYFKDRPRLRLFFATFMAAGVGNFVYHYLWGVWLIQERGVLGHLIAMQSYALYALILSVSIGVSQLRAATRPPVSSTSWLSQLRTLGFVFGFYCLMTILDEAGAHGVADCFAFATHLLPGDLR